VEGGLIPAEISAADQPDGTRLVLVPAHYLRVLSAELEVDRKLVNFDRLGQTRADRRPKGLVLSDYHDGFAVFRTTHHTLGGYHTMIANLPQAVSRHLHDRYVLAMTPFQGNADDALLPFLSAIRKSALSPITTPQGPITVVWHSGRADMVDANKRAHVKGPSALRPCRFCLVGKDCLCHANPSRSLQLRRTRNFWEMRRVRQEAEDEEREDDRQATLTDYGLLAGEPAVRQARLPVDPHRTLVVDVFHSQGGRHRDMLGLSFKHYISVKGLRRLADTLVNFVLPFGSKSMPNIHLYKTFTLSQALNIASFLPLALVTASVKARPHDLADLLPVDLDEAYRCFLDVWSGSAAANHLVFAQSVTAADVTEMDELLRECTQKLVLVSCCISSSFLLLRPAADLLAAHLEAQQPAEHARPAAHCGHDARHGHRRQRRYCAGRSAPSRAKGRVPHTNHREMDRTLLEHADTLDAVRAIHDRQAIPSDSRTRDAVATLAQEVPKLFASSVFGFSAATPSSAAGPSSFGTLEVACDHRSVRHPLRCAGRVR
jgi:hypothetical protein